MNQSTKINNIKKDEMIKALEQSLGVVTLACRKIGIDRTTHYLWMNTDAEYKKAVDELADVALDFAESKLHENMAEKDTTALIFYLKTKGKKRGYVERTEIEHSGLQLTFNEGSEACKKQSTLNTPSTD